MRARVPPGETGEAGGEGDQPAAVVGWDGKSPAPLASEALTEQQIDSYLEALESGVDPALAARAIGMTATRMRRLRKRDQEFRERCEEATREAHEQYVARLRATARLKATQEGSDRMLEVELATHVPEYDHLKRNRVQVDAHVTMFTRERLEALTDEQLDALDGILAVLAGDDVVDGEYEDITDEQPQIGEGE